METGKLISIFSARQFTLHALNFLDCKLMTDYILLKGKVFVNIKTVLPDSGKLLQCRCAIWAVMLIHDVIG